MYGDGNTSRDYTFVDDVVQGIINAMSYNKTNFEIINIGNNHAVSLKELIHSIEEVTGKKAIIERLPEQPGDVQRTCADITKAKQLLGYNPQTRFNDGLKKFYNWFLQNEKLLLND